MCTVLSALLMTVSHSDIRISAYVNTCSCQVTRRYELLCLCVDPEQDCNVGYLLCESFVAVVWLYAALVQLGCMLFCFFLHPTPTYNFLH